jgi:transposase
MPRPFPAEFRLRAVALVRAGKPITRTAQELGVSVGALHGWVRQDKIDRGEIKGITTKESAELTRANKRIRELELEVEILKRASKFLGKDKADPKGFTR